MVRGSRRKTLAAHLCFLFCVRTPCWTCCRRGARRAFVKGSSKLPMQEGEADVVPSLARSTEMLCMVLLSAVCIPSESSPPPCVGGPLQLHARCALLWPLYGAIWHISHFRRPRCSRALHVLCVCICVWVQKRGARESERERERKRQVSAIQYVLNGYMNERRKTSSKEKTTKQYIIQRHDITYTRTKRNKKERREQKGTKQSMQGTNHKRRYTRDNDETWL